MLGCAAGPTEPPYPGATETPGDPYPLGTPVTPEADQATDAGPVGMGTPESAPDTLPRRTAPAQAPTPSPSAIPTPIPWTSPLVLDSAAGHVYTSAGSGAAARLLVYSTRDGRLIEERPLDRDERLLDVDAERGRVYVYRPDRGLRLLDSTGGEEARLLPLPTPDPADAVEAHSPTGHIIVGPPIERLAPIVHPTSGEVLTFHDKTVSWHDLVSGNITRRLDAPLPAEAGSIYRAAITEDGRILYLAVIDPALTDWTDQPGTILLALDLVTGEVIERRDKRALATDWLAWSDSLLATFDVYKDTGSRHSLWSEGREVRELFESTLRWRTHDSLRDRLVSAPQTAWADGEYYDELALADSETLDLRALARWRGGHVSNDSGPPILPFSNTLGLAHTMLYDPGTDQMIARTYTLDRLGAALAAAIQPEPTPAEDRGTEPRFEARPGVGIVRSDDGGTTWTPAGEGIDHLGIMEVVKAPNFAADATLFATSFLGIQSRDGAERPTTWRSRNGGEDWEPVGRFAAVAFSPDYATDRMVMAFDYLDTGFHVSADGGDTWEPRGRLPEINYREDVATRLWTFPARGDGPPVLVAMGNDNSSWGGPPHWPEAGARLFRSVDGGRTWELAWQDPLNPWHTEALDGELLGPISVRAGQYTSPESAWMVVLFLSYASPCPIVLTTLDGGLTWHEVFLPEDGGARPIAVSDGDILVRSTSRHESTVPLDRFEFGRSDCGNR